MPGATAEQADMPTPKMLTPSVKWAFGMKEVAIAATAVEATPMQKPCAMRAPSSTP